MISKIDNAKLKDAISAADFLANIFIENNGRYIVNETWGPEGLLYLAESSYALHSLYEITKNPKYIEAVKSILEELKRIQKPSGGWALEIGKHGNGVGFKVPDDVKKLTEEIEDLPPTVAMLKTISDYQNITGDETYSEMGNNAFKYLLEHWDEKYGSFLEKENNKLMALRSNPRSYHLFSYVGIYAWSRVEPEKCQKMLPILLKFIKDTFEDFDEQTMPLVFGLHAGIILQNADNEYIHNVIKPKIEKQLIFNKTFEIENPKGAFGHRDGLRGIVVNEAHMRSAAGIAIAMKFFDIYSNSQTFTNTEKYLNIESWIQQMKGANYYYEFEILPERKKIGFGSPGQYLPIWWILGTI